MIELYLSTSDLESILNGELEGFTLTSDGSNVGDESCEDDGREYRLVTFKENATGLEFYFNYVWHPHFGIDLSCELLSHDSRISIRNDPITKLPPIKPADPIKVLSPEELADKELMERYHNTTTTPYKPKMAPKHIIDDVISFVNTKKFSAIDLRAKVIPVCIEYGVEESSFWEYIQIKRGVWKKRK